jgi:hypothetical protein
VQAQPLQLPAQLLQVEQLLGVNQQMGKSNFGFKAAYHGAMLRAFGANLLKAEKVRVLLMVLNIVCGGFIFFQLGKVEALI